MNTVDEIYELIKKDNSQNTLNNNVDLFIRFYYQEMSMYYGSYKVKEIYKYVESLDFKDDDNYINLKDEIKKKTSIIKKEEKKYNKEAKKYNKKLNEFPTSIFKLTKFKTI